MKVAAIMQPTFLPWLGYFDLMDSSDVFVFLDSVQFVKRSWQQRNKIKTKNGPLLLTVPVITKGLYQQKINDVKIDKTELFYKKCLKTLDHSYSKSLYYNKYLKGGLSDILKKDHTYLVDLNIEIILFLKDVLGIKTEILKSSNLKEAGSKGDRLLSICRNIGVDTYLSPRGSKSYLDNDNPFLKSEIRFEFHNYEHPLHAQMHGEFFPYLSIVDLISNHGGDSLDIIRSGRLGEKGVRIEKQFDRLWPLCRSITGPGYRESLDILSEMVPFERVQFETGRQVFDWTVPKEWIARDAYIVGPNGKKYCDFKKSNLHLVSYSIPFKGKLPLSELKKYIHSIPDQPDAIPYRTSYYNERWGFCITDKELRALPDGMYDVVVDTDHVDGGVEVGEAVLPGESKREIVFSSYLCHPSMANNELSGPLVLAFLYEKLAKRSNRQFTYRFVIGPETIGAISYLSVRGDHLREYMSAGYQLTCLGDRSRFTYKKSRRDDSLADRAASVVLTEWADSKIIPFNPSMGSDERQYCSPGFNLPMGLLMRTLSSPQYHTSLDNKDYISFKRLEESVDLCYSIAEALEENKFYLNLYPHGEVQLGKRGLYPTLGGSASYDHKARFRARMWLLNMADGSHDLISIAQKSSIPMSILIEVAKELLSAELIKEI